MTNFKAHDKVTWNSPQGKVQGTVVKKMISDSEYEGLTITASSKEPRYVVKSSSSGKVAAHKADSLSKQ